MVYVALLRGINVGGSRKVGMQQLKSVFEEAGMSGVRTYINSGNVIFSTRPRGRARLVDALERAIGDRFGFEVKVLLRDVDGLRSVVQAIPARWSNDQTMGCDVLFLWEDVDRPSVVDEMPVRSGIDDVRYTPGAVIWRVDRDHRTRSGMLRLAGTPLYRRITVRNCNTTRKLLELMEA